MFKTCKGCGAVVRPNKNVTRNMCDGCSILKKKPFGFPSIKKTVYLKGYGYESVERLKELDRRVILPTERKDGGYYLGRRGENGKIQDREPNY